MLNTSAFSKRISSVVLSLGLLFQVTLQAATVDLYIIAGQSNGNGQALVNTLTPAQSAAHNAFFYCSWHQFAHSAEPSFGSPQLYSGWLTQTQAGETRSMGNVSTTFGTSPWFGPEIGFAARANEINLSSNQLGIIKYAVDGSGLTAKPANPNESDWDTNATGVAEGDAWRGFQAALSNAVTSLQNDGHTPNFKGMIWWQGENGTNATDLNAFIAAVRNHLGTNHGVTNSDNFPVVITGNDFWGAGLKTGVADPDPHIGFIDSVTYGQTGGYTNVHIGSAQGGNPTDVTGSGNNDMWDIGRAYADEMANILPAQTGGNIVDVFIATGQSNAFYPNNQGVENYYGFGRGVQAALTASGQFSNPTVVMDGAPGFSIAGWWAEYVGTAGEPNIKYDEHFFDTDNSGTGKLEAKINEIIANGDTPRFRGVFWWQGESDGIGPYATANTTQAAYEARWAGMLNQLESDLTSAGLATDQYNFVVNTVAESGAQINTILNGIGTAATNGVTFDTQVAPYNVNPAINEPQYGNLHVYDHFAVGEANVNLFINSFISPTTYQITFINLDDSHTTQTVNAGDIATPPAGVSTATRTFTAWPTISPATADNSYTALYTNIGGGSSSVTATLSQSVHGATGPTPINLTAEGTMDWGVFSNSTLNPNTTMDGGAGYSRTIYLGGAADAFYNFHSENSYTWTNGTPSTSASNTLTTNASLGSNGDGIRLTFNLPAAGVYQLKFYSTTADTNLSATASLSDGTSDTVTGSLVAGLQKYQYTIDFTTAGADTLTLDVVKNGAGSILAYEAFSLSSIITNITSNGTPHSWLDSFNLVTGGDYESADLLDSDNDGVSNRLEYEAGTDPTDPTSFFSVIITSDNSNITLTWSPVDGKTYNIQHSSDLGINDPWQNYQTNVPYTSGQDISITIPKGSETKYFYRIFVE